MGLKISVFVFVLIGYLQLAYGLRTNLTMFGNCRDMDLAYEKAPVSISKVSYDRDPDGVCNTMHVEYDIRESSEDEHFELVLTSYQCPLGVTELCKDNPQEFVESMHCDRLHSDDSGPWHMLTSAMTNGDRCGRVQGHFNIDAAVLKIKYLDKYIEMGKGSYRVRMLFHVANTDMSTKNMKGCCEMDFDVID
ncbi:uncharacterized protein LOC129747406 [Uranotaenia lowii]|uniref:uncharacterized protein LOC129747406 n=1 Tax=Uranotaenia lowii TaxID=190385 RepID=UPI002478F110|nr:uncharacterized protein LOC129747406 [Uranotaenia lowii]